MLTCRSVDADMNIGIWIIHTELLSLGHGATLSHHKIVVRLTFFLEALHFLRTLQV